MTYRNQNQAWVAGVAAGLAEKWHLPVLVIRAAFVILFMILGLGLFLYLMAWNKMAAANNNQLNLSI